MKKEKAIEIFNKWMDCKDAYQADPSCDGNCFSCEYYASAEEEKEAMLLAISALEKQEQDRWIPVTERLPERGVDVLVTQLPNDWNGKKYKVSPAWRCNIEDVRPHGEWALTGRLDLFASVIPIDKVSAWRPLPEAFQGE